MQNKVVEFRHLGLLDYQKALDYQEKLFKKTIDLKIKNKEKIFWLIDPINRWLPFVIRVA